MGLKKPSQLCACAKPSDWFELALHRSTHNALYKKIHLYQHFFIFKHRYICTLVNSKSKLDQKAQGLVVNKSNAGLVEVTAAYHWVYD